MNLTNNFHVGVPVDEAWSVLTNVERIAPCLPGAQLKEVNGDEYRGIVKVKVGPVTAAYHGSAQFLQLDHANHRAVLKAEGRETRGQGNASATITASLTPSASGTDVQVVTDLEIAGKVAQFGRGVLAGVSAEIIEQFVQNLGTTVLSPGGRGTEAGPGADGQPPPAPSGDQRATAPAGSAAPRRIEGPEPKPINLVGMVGGPLARRLVPVASIAGGLLLIAIYVLQRRRGPWSGGARGRQRCGVPAVTNLIASTIALQFKPDTGTASPTSTPLNPEAARGRPDADRACLLVGIAETSVAGAFQTTSTEALGAAEAHVPCPGSLRRCALPRPWQWDTLPGTLGCRGTPLNRNRGADGSRACA